MNDIVSFKHCNSHAEGRLRNVAYPHSDPVDPLTLEANGCVTTLPVRCSKYQDLANSTSQTFFLEWNNAGIKGDLRRSSFDPNGHAFSLSIPECLPERVEVGTRLYDVGFYNDGLMPVPNAELTLLTKVAPTRPSRRR